MLPTVKEGCRSPERGHAADARGVATTGRDPSVTALMPAGPGRSSGSGNRFRRRTTGNSPAPARWVPSWPPWDQERRCPLLKELMKECRCGRTTGELRRSRRMLTGTLRRSLAQFYQHPGRARRPRGPRRVCRLASDDQPEDAGIRDIRRIAAAPATSEHPALAGAARGCSTTRRLPGCRSSPEARGKQTPPFQNLFASPLIVVAGFREGVFTGLADKAPLGTLGARTGRHIERKIKDLPTTTLLRNQPRQLDGVAIGVDYPFRGCDFLASNLSGARGLPSLRSLLARARRDQAVAACAAYLKRFGAGSRPNPPPATSTTQAQRPPEVPHARQAGDARRRRRGPGDLLARGQGEVRLAKMPGFRSRRMAHPQGHAGRSDLLSRGSAGVTRPNTTPTATSGRPRRSAREIVGSVSMASSATTSSPGHPPRRSSSPADRSVVVEPRGGLDARTELVDPPARLTSRAGRSW